MFGEQTRDTAADVAVSPTPLKVGDATQRLYKRHQQGVAERARSTAAGRTRKNLNCMRCSDGLPKRA